MSGVAGKERVYSAVKVKDVRDALSALPAQVCAIERALDLAEEAGRVVDVDSLRLTVSRDFDWSTGSDDPVALLEVYHYPGSD